MQPDKAMQLKRYAYMVTRHRPEVEEIHVYIDNVRLGVKSGPVKFFVEDLVSFGEILESEISRVQEDRVFSWTPGNACYQCGVAYACRAKLDDIGTIDSRESAEAAVRKIALDEARISVMKKAIKGSQDPSTKMAKSTQKVVGESRPLSCACAWSPCPWTCTWPAWSCSASPERRRQARRRPQTM